MIEPNAPPSHRASYRTVAIKAFFLFVPLMALLVLLFYQMYRLELGYKKEQLLATEARHLELHNQILTQTVSSVVKSLQFLTSLPEAASIAERGATKAAESNLAKIFMTLAQREKTYDQVRLLNLDGMEVLRVNYKDGHARLLPRGELQNKANRYYFKDTLQLGVGKVFISPLDLNIERGEIERPFKPMIRFGSPVFDALGYKKGIILTNYLGEELLSSLQELSTSTDGNILLLNSDGYWLRGGPQGDNWGFMFPDRQEKAFAKTFPDVWKRILEQKSGQLFDQGDLFTFSAIRPIPEGQRSSTGSSEAYGESTRELKWNEYFWVLVSHVPSNQLNIALSTPLKNFFFLTGAIGLLLALGVWFLTRALEDKKVAATILASKSEELSNTNASLFDANTALSEAKDAAESSSRSKSEFLANMSHEVRTPLNGVLGVMQILRETPLNDEQMEFLELGLNSGKSLVQIINDILDLSKIEAGKLVIASDEFDPSNLLNTIIELLKMQARDKHLNLYSTLDKIPPICFKVMPGVSGKYFSISLATQ